MERGIARGMILIDRGVSLKLEVKSECGGGDGG